MTKDNHCVQYNKQNTGTMSIIVNKTSKLADVSLF